MSEARGRELRGPGCGVVGDEVARRAAADGWCTCSAVQPRRGPTDCAANSLRSKIGPQCIVTSGWRLRGEGGDCAGDENERAARGSGRVS